MREKQYILYKEGEQIGYYTKKQISAMLPEIDAQALIKKGKHDLYELKEMYEINNDGTFTCICYECGKSFIHECNKNLCPECRKEFDIQTKKRANERKKIRLKKQRREKREKRKRTNRRRTQLDDIAREAKQNGMSYGSYVASLQSTEKRTAKEILKNF